jgi:hypothetical protein
MDYAEYKEKILGYEASTKELKAQVIGTVTCFVKGLSKEEANVWLNNDETSFKLPYTKYHGDYLKYDQNTDTASLYVRNFMNPFTMEELPLEDIISILNKIYQK